MSGNGERQFDDIDEQLMAELGFDGDLGFDKTKNKGDKEYSRKKTIRQSIGAAAVAVLAGGIAFGGIYTWESLAAGGPKVSSSVDLATAGHGKVESINMKIDPITITTFDTKVKGTKTEFETDLDTGNFLGNLKIPMIQRSITRTTNVETQVQLTPTNVGIEWQPPKEDTKGDAKYGQLYVKVPDGAMSQTSKVTTADTTDTGGNIVSMSAETTQALASLIGSVFGGGASEVPLLNGVGDGSMSIDNALENYSNLATTVNVGKACTKSVMGVSHYTDDLKKNVVPAAEGILLSNDPDVEKAVNKGIPTLSQMPVSALKTLLKHAIVLLPGETIDKPNAPTTMKVPSDEADIKQLANYSKSQKVSMTVKQASSSKMTCDASDAKLIENTTTGAGGGN